MIAINNIVTILFRLQFHKKKLIYRLRDLGKKDKIRMQLQSVQRNNFCTHFKRCHNIKFHLLAFVVQFSPALFAKPFKALVKYCSFVSECFCVWEHEKFSVLSIIRIFSNLLLL